MTQGRASIVLEPRARARTRASRWVARALCTLLAICGLLPLAAALAIRTPAVRGYVAAQTRTLLAAQGIDAKLEVQAQIWPIAVTLENVVVASKDGGAPAIVAPHAKVTLKALPLLSGKVVLDEVAVDSPRIRLVIEGSRIANLGIDLPKSDPNAPKSVFRAPFGGISVSDAALDLTVDGVHAELFGVDADMVADPNSRSGNDALEVALRANRIAVTSQLGTPQLPAIYNDELCAVDGRIRIVPTEMITVRRLDFHGSADRDGAPDTFGGCALPKDDPRSVNLSVGHAQIDISRHGEVPQVSGHFKGHLPLAVVSRIEKAPDVDGTVDIDADVRLTRDRKLPETTGTVHVHGARIGKFAIADDITSALAIRDDTITSTETTVQAAGGTATLRNVRVSPFAPGIPLAASVEVHGASFESLMRELGVSKTPHVAWNLDDLRVSDLQGQLDPLKLDGVLTGTTSKFAVYDLAVKDPKRARVVGFESAQVSAKIAVRPDALQFSEVRAVVGRSVLSGGFVSIGFHDLLRVDVPNADIDLRDLTPLGSMPISGHMKGSVYVNGVFDDPHLVADASIDDFVLSDLPLGNVTQAHGVLKGVVLELSDVKAIKGNSHYEMPSGRLDFGGSANVTVDADVATKDFELRDLLALFRMETDPRFAELAAHAEATANVRVVLGGVEDPCGGGTVQVKANVHANRISLFQERFADAHADLEFNWLDRKAGIEGADFNLRGFALHKLHDAQHDPQGSLLGSATLERGGILRGNFVYDSIALSKVDKLGPMRELVRGDVSGVANVSGTLDDFTVDGSADVSPVRIHNIAYGASRLTYQMTTAAKPLIQLGKTACGGPIRPLFDKAEYLRNAATESAGQYVLNGTLFGGQVELDNVSMTRQLHAAFAGRIGFRNIDLATLRAVVAPLKGSAAETEPQGRIGGTFSADLLLDQVKTDELRKAKAQLYPRELKLQVAGQTVVLEPTEGALRIEGDTLMLPALSFAINSSAGAKAQLAISGAIRDLIADPKFDMALQLTPVELGILVGLVPRVTRAQGTLTGRVTVVGKLTEPEVEGELHLRRGEFALSNVDGIISDLTLDVAATSNELRLTWGTAKYAGGDVVVLGRMPLIGSNAGRYEASIVARNLHMQPSDAVRTAFDLDLGLSGNAWGEKIELPKLAGTVSLNSLEYTKGVNIDIAQSLGTNARRTVVNNYDPSLDTLALDLNVVAKAPLRIRNNIAEIDLGIEGQGLQITGTNQRYGVRGELRARPQGRIKLLSNDFEVRQLALKFDDPTRVAAYLDASAVTDYRRASAIASSAGPASGRNGSSFRITLRAFGPADDPKVEMSAEPALSQEDISLLLTVGLTKAEVDQLGSSALTAFAYEAVGTASGADRAVKRIIPVDDFRFGSHYSPRTGRTEPNITFGQRITEGVRATLTSGIAEDRQIRTTVEARINQNSGVQLSYDNINNVSSVGIGNFGADYRLRIEWE